MRILGVDHLEFYVGDARQTAYFLCAAFGFRISGQGGPQTGLAGQRSLLVRHGDIHLVLTTGLEPDHPATEYVRRHGDGVAVIALAVDDEESAYAELVSKGAKGLGDGRVAGFGDVIHRLVQRRGDAAFSLPGIEPDGTADSQDEGLLEVIDHLAFCVPAGELATTSKYYQDVFGFDEIFEEYIEVGSQGMDSLVVQSNNQTVTFTIIEPDPRRQPGQIDDFLSWHAGAGVQHVAFRTSDIIKAVTTFSGRGVGFLSTPGSYYDALAGRLTPVDVPIEALRKHSVLVDEDHWGQMYQIFTQSMHIRRTLFLELIERHGALTFGTSNIRALYAAKERELAAAAEPGGKDA
jgi:4-hydroxymandelate synthase